MSLHALRSENELRVNAPSPFTEPKQEKIGRMIAWAGAVTTLIVCSGLSGLIWFNNR